ncbi:MAG: ATP-dependent DNA helicase [Candidatus Nitrohelix vancouverensis]|uniref:DNA 5'-3' helicase n=1 Tax=Candidatus Nitrohelix vancouverensis TaxID=2705534 RepID=A0A7T0C590_9BACT|nr:MAG: ATP-dependent DNA helicase [Candidatus Nitrohelix vancouverensis]
MNPFDAEELLGPEGLAARAMPGFEYRPQQAAMADAVAKTLESGGHLMVEAGTGTGKSLAYLIPAVLWAVQNDKRVVVSTYTKTLQHQILHHDIPLLRQRLGLSFRYSICLGHENYLSLRRMKRAGQAGLFVDPEQEEQLAEIFEWSSMTASGVKEELEFTPLPAVWEEVGRQKDLCLGKNCETYRDCFYFKERKRWFASHLLVVNHHLFFANVAAGGGALPRFDAVIFDEAQNVEEAATSFLGLEVSNSSLNYFLDRLYNPRGKKGMLGRIERSFSQEAIDLVMKTRRAAEAFFAQTLEVFGRDPRNFRLYQPPPLLNVLCGPLEELRDALKVLEAMIGEEEESVEFTYASNRCMDFYNAINVVMGQQLPGYVYSLEIVDKKRFRRVSFQAAPVNVAEELKRQVYETTDRIVLTSATLTANGKFDFVKGRIGFEPNDELTLDSPFDYARQALLYAPADLPEPSEEPDVYATAIAARSKALVEASGGRAFILFTSYALLNRVYEKMETLVSQFQLLRQGDAPRSQMIEQFKRKPSIIFGTNTFWQGVDVPGEALQCVIITKLPFDPPGEPLTEARMEDLKKRGIDPFSRYQIPRAILQLRQGFGRLIRKGTDAGVVAILDSRVVHRSYGKKFIASLPPCRVTESMDEVRQFFTSDEKAELVI